MCYKFFTLFLFFRLIFSYIPEYSYLSQNLSNEEKFVDSFSSLSLEIKIDKHNYNFIQFVIQNGYTSFFGQIAFLSFFDKDCNEDRKHIIYSHYGYYDDYMMIINKYDLEGLEKFYICVKCIEKDDCEYRLFYILIDGDNMRSLIGYTNYIYIASEKYKQINMSIETEGDGLDYEFYWLKRMFYNDYIKYYYYNDKVKIKEDYNTICILQSSKIEKDFNILSKEGDYIILGSDKVP